MAFPAVGDPGTNTVSPPNDHGSKLLKELVGMHYNVRAYGAVGNGSTDDTAAFQAAIDAAAAAGVGKVLIPDGTYVLTQIKLKTNVTLEGVGWGSSLRCKNSNASTAMVILNSNTVVQTRIRRLFFDGNKANQTIPVTAVKYLRETGNPAHVIEDCFIWSWSGRGVDCDCQNTTIRDNYFWINDQEGIYVSFNDCRIYNNEVGNCGLEGISLNAASNCHITDNNVWGSGQVNAARGDGIRLANACTQVKAMNNEPSYNLQHGWSIEGCSQVSILGGQTANNTAAPLRIKGGRRHFIRMFFGDNAVPQPTLIQFDTDGSYPTACNIECAYTNGSATGAIGATNPELTGTFSTDNYIKINHRIVVGGLDFHTASVLGSWGGAIRLGNNQEVYARNNANTGDVSLFRFETFDQLRFFPITRFLAGIVFDGGDITLNTTGVKIGTATTQKIGFWNKAPIVQPTAYTQTFSTADKTHAARTSAATATTAATQTTPWGFSTQAQADAIVTNLNAVRADLDDTAQLLNSVIDDLQAMGLLA